jgi:uncharacterized protein (TIGR00255 family)
VIKSMTGFAASAREDERATVSVTVRAVNHRHLDLQVRLPASLAGLEADVRAIVARAVARGRVEVGVSVQTRQTSTFQVELNEAFCDALTRALEDARARGLVAGSLAPGDLLRLPQALAIREQAAAPDAQAEAELADRVRGALEDAVADLDTMRAREGDHLRADLEDRRQAVADLVERIAAAAAEGRAAVEARLAERVKEIARTVEADATAVAQEIVKAAARSDISEELSRFRGHVAHWSALADAAEPCGRKLDFLLQEMNREVNTMGSKADGLRVSELIIAAKAELEKMREQVQNVE